MINFKSILCILAMLSSSIYASDHGNHMGVVDVRQLVEGSSMMKAMAADLEKQFNPQKEKLIAMQKDLEEASAKLTKNQATMAPKERKNLEQQIETKRNDMMQKEQQFRSELYQAQNESINKIMEKVKAEVSQVAQKRGIEVVLSSNEIVWSDTKIDLTKEVAQKLN